MNETSLQSFSLLYAEDDSVIRQAYLNYFQTIFKVVHSACDGKEAYELYKEHQPDILLFDINMPYLNGLELVKKIRETNSEVKILILTAHLDEEKLLQAIPLGLSDYLKKPVKQKELRDALFKVALELEQTNTSLLKLSDSISWDTSNHLLYDEDQLVHLTKSELLLMKVLTSKAKTHFSLDDILEEFWQYKSQKEMTENSIRNIIKRLKQKLPPECIANYYGIGYKLCLYE